MGNKRSGLAGCVWLLALGAGMAWAQDPPPADDAAAAEQFEHPVDVSEEPTIPVAQEAPPTTTVTEAPVQQLEEITVTAQKTRQSARDVPISMSVLNDDFIAQRGIVDIVQAMQYVPNVKIASGGFFAAPQARGFSFNNNNKAFESPLGIAFDGIPYTNTTYFNAGLFDVERIEVLRGPQGTTFGKNTTAGLVSIITADPTPDWRGVASVQYGQLGRQRVEIAVGGPLWEDVVDFRVAGIYNTSEGYVRNTTAEVVPGVPEISRGYDHRGYRAKLRFPDIFGSNLKLQYESVDMSNSGAGIEIWKAGEAFKAFNRQYDPNADFELGNNVNSLDGPDYRRAHADTALAEWNLPIGEWVVTALGGHSVLDETIGVDVEFSPTPGLNGYGADVFPTTSLELRASSPSIDGLFGLQNLFGLDLGHTEFLGGFFYQRRSIEDSYFRFVLNDGPFLGETAAALADANGEDIVAILGGIPLPGGLLIDVGSLSQKQDIFVQEYNQHGSAMALFQQTAWHFLPDWVLQLGLRASREKKTGEWYLHFDSPPPDTLLLLLGLTEFSAERTIEETTYQPKVSLNWQPTDKISLFAHWTRGFKGGGFNAFAYRDEDDDLVYRPETTTEWGFDLKSGFFGGVFRTNLSLYRMRAKDFQVLGREKPPVVGIPGVDPVCTDTACFPPSVIGLGTTRVFNAPDAYAQGVEADFTWMIGGGLSLLGTVGYNDTKYNDFRENECPASESRPTCDATGRPFAFAPRWDATLTPSWIINLPWGLSLTPTFTAAYISSQILDTDLREDKRQRGFVRYNATLAIGDLVRGWSVQVVGKNLTDERTAVRYGDVFSGVLVSVPESPRELFAQLRWTF